MLMNESLVLGYPMLARDRMEEVNGCVCGREVMYSHVETSRITQDRSLLYLTQSWPCWELSEAWPHRYC